MHPLKRGEHYRKIVVELQLDEDSAVEIDRGGLIIGPQIIETLLYLVVEKPDGSRSVELDYRECEGGMFYGGAFNSPGLAVFCTSHHYGNCREVVCHRAHCKCMRPSKT